MSKTVMIVDDSSSVRQVVKNALTGEGYAVIEAENGKDALTKVDRDGAHLIICDVNMPVMNGIAFVQEFRKIPKFQYTPVIMLTTESDQKLKDQGKSAGVKAWMVKPFDDAKMITAVKTLIM